VEQGETGKDVLAFKQKRKKTFLRVGLKKTTNNWRSNGRDVGRVNRKEKGLRGVGGRKIRQNSQNLGPLIEGREIRRGKSNISERSSLAAQKNHHPRKVLLKGKVFKTG